MHFTVEKKNAKKLIKQSKSNFRKTSKELVQQMVEKKTKKQKTRVTTTVNKSVLLRRYQQYRREKKLSLQNQRAVFLFMVLSQIFT